MTDYIQNMMLPAASGGGVIIIEAVESNESKTSVSLITADNRKPTLKATVERIWELYPFVTRIRVYCYGDLGLAELCIFRMIDGIWLEQLPPYMRPKLSMSASERREALKACFIGSVNLTGD